MLPSSRIELMQPSLRSGQCSEPRNRVVRRPKNLPSRDILPRQEVATVDAAQQTLQRVEYPDRPLLRRPTDDCIRNLLARPPDPRVTHGELNNWTSKRAYANDRMVQ